MNPADFKSFLSEVLNNPEKVGNVEEVLTKSLEMYKELVSSVKEASLEERKKIQESLVDINDFFNQQFEAVSSQMGMSKEELLLEMQNPENYTDDVWASIKKFETDVDKEKRSLVRTVQGGNKPAKKRASIKAPRLGV